MKLINEWHGFELYKFFTHLQIPMLVYQSLYHIIIKTILKKHKETKKKNRKLQKRMLIKIASKV
jgi:predicted acyl esterase